ncbi:MAG: hypothetical protein ACHQNV_11525, partial [Vicinamibacteria bacterium]
MSEDPLTAIADEVIELSDSGQTVAAFTSRHPGFDAEMAYRIAARLHDHRLGRGWKPLGRKIGFTNRTIWARYDVFQPIWG